MGNLSFSGKELLHSSLRLDNLEHTDARTHTNKPTRYGKLPPSGSTEYLTWLLMSFSQQEFMSFYFGHLWFMTSPDVQHTLLFISDRDWTCFISVSRCRRGSENPKTSSTRIGVRVSGDPGGQLCFHPDPKSCKWEAMSERGRLREQNNQPVSV